MAMERNLTVNANDVLSRLDEEKTSWHDLESARRSRTICTGRITDIVQRKDASPLAVVKWRGQDGNLDLDVVIRLEEMGISTAQNNDAQIQSRILDAMINAEIDFIIISTSNEDGVIAAVGSRVDAMKLKARMFYDEETNNRVKIHVGDEIPARIIAVARHYMIVEAYGCEVALRGSMVQKLWTNDLRAGFHPGERGFRVGDVKKIVVTNIEVDEKGVIISASGITERDIEIHDAKKAKIVGGSVLTGKVANVREDGTYLVALAKGVNAVAHSCRSNMRPVSGDFVRFKYTGQDRGDFITGTILSII